MNIPWRRIKPGWYLLVFLLLYSILMTTLLARSNRMLREARTLPTEITQVEVLPEPDELENEAAPEGLWFPITGAELPQDPSFLPNARRAYRQGVSQGFDFYGEDAGIPIPYGTPVIAAADAAVTRLDSDYRELEPEAWRTLLAEVARSGAEEEQLDRLRGRQVWLRTDDDITLRYGHLSSLAEGLNVGDRVYRGQVIGYVGNSGTDDGVAGSTRGARLHFEVWQPDGTFVGDGLDEEAVRAAAGSLFVGP